MSAEDLMRQANTLAENLRDARRVPRSGRATDAHEVAAMEARLAGLWTAIRAARAPGAVASDGTFDRRGRSKWDAPASRDRRR